VYRAGQSLLEFCLIEAIFWSEGATHVQGIARNQDERIHTYRATVSDGFSIPPSVEDVSLDARRVEPDT
jgi:hypothetical protein